MSPAVAASATSATGAFMLSTVTRGVAIPKGFILGSTTFLHGPLSRDPAARWHVAANSTDGWMANRSKLHPARPARDPYDSNRTLDVERSAFYHADEVALAARAESANRRMEKEGLAQRGVVATWAVINRAWAARESPRSEV